MRLSIIFDSTKILLFGYDNSGNTPSLIFDTSVSTDFVDIKFDYFGNDASYIFVITEDLLAVIDGTGIINFGTIPFNSGALYKKLYDGVDQGSITLYKIDQYGGLGSETIQIYDIAGGNIVTGKQIGRAHV